MKSPLHAVTSALLFCCVVCPRSSHGGVVLGNLGADGSGSLSSFGASTSAQTWIAQGFNTGSSSLLYLDAITLGLKDDFGPTTVTLFLYSDVSGSPGTFLTSASSTVSSTPQKVSFGEGGYQLTANTTYWAVIGTNNLVWMEADTVTPVGPQNASGYSYSGLYFTTNAGSTWITNGPYTDISFSVAASSTPAAVPEPGTWAVALLLMGGAVVACWRRRAQIS